MCPPTNKRYVTCVRKEKYQYRPTHLVLLCFHIIIKLLLPVRLAKQNVDMSNKPVTHHLTTHLFNEKKLG